MRVVLVLCVCMCVCWKWCVGYLDLFAPYLRRCVIPQALPPPSAPASAQPSPAASGGTRRFSSYDPSSTPTHHTVTVTVVDRTKREGPSLKSLLRTLLAWGGDDLLGGNLVGIAPPPEGVCVCVPACVRACVCSLCNSKGSFHSFSDLLFFVAPLTSVHHVYICLSFTCVSCGTACSTADEQHSYDCVGD